jgi:TorA maturation chaperone TorD
MSATVTPLSFQPPEAPEDRARAGYYALLARLFYAGPDPQLLNAIANADEIVAGAERSALAAAWNGLAVAAGAVDAEAARLEYDELLVGTGRAAVTPYASFYLAETGREKILVRLRSELAELGLARADGAHEPEDHMAGLFEVMRHLISLGSGDVSLGSGDAALQKQREFFDGYIARSFPGFCAAISASDKANFYKAVGLFAQAFLAVEDEGLKVF